MNPKMEPQRFFESADETVSNVLLAHWNRASAKQFTAFRMSRGKNWSHYFFQYRMYGISIEVGAKEIVFTSTSSFSPTKRKTVFYVWNDVDDKDDVLIALRDNTEAMWRKLEGTTSMSGLTGFAFPFGQYGAVEEESVS